MTVHRAAATDEPGDHGVVHGRRFRVGRRSPLGSSIASTVFLLVPLYWVVVTSIKPPDDYPRGRRPSGFPTSRRHPLPTALNQMQRLEGAREQARSSPRS